MRGPQETLNIDADQLNAHYAHISTDSNYGEPSKKHSCAVEDDPSINEYQIFKMLDNLKATSHGTDGLPHWFLRLAAPSICPSSCSIHLFSCHTSFQIVSPKFNSSKSMENQHHNTCFENQTTYLL